MRNIKLNNQTERGISSPSSALHPRAQFNQVVEPSTSHICISLFGLLATLFGSFLLTHSAYAVAPYLNVSSGAPEGLVKFEKVQPSATGEMSTAQDNLTINTNCSIGYNVYISATNNGDTNLTNDSASGLGNNIISTSSATVGGTATALSPNTWGINGNSVDVSDNKYFGLPTYAKATDNPLITKASVAEQTTVPIYYGAKVTTAIAPGTYSGEVLYTVLPNDACTYYTVHYDTNNGTGTMDNQVITVGRATNLSKSTFTRTGYTFLGWSNSANGKTGTATNGIGTMDDVDYTDEQSVTDIADFNTTKTLYAIWIENYTINYDKGSATSGTPSKTTEGNKLKSESITTATVGTMAKTGYDFKGWALTNNATTAKYNANASVNISTIIADATTAGQATTAGSTITLYAVWTINNYNLTVSNGNTTAVSSMTVNGTTKSSGTATSITYNTSTTVACTPKSGYHCTGWTSNNTSLLPSSSSASYNFNMPAGAVTLTANGAANSFTISYNANGGTGSASGGTTTASYGTNVTMASNGTLAKSGYDFLGWSLSNTATSATWTAGQGSISPTAIKSNVTTVNGGSVTVYAVWKSSKPYMQTTSCSSLTKSSTTTLYDSRDEQAYTVYRWPSTGTAGTSYPSNMGGYCIMTKDLSLGYVTGGSVTKGANLTLTTSNSAAAATITARTGTSDWSTTNSDDNKQYINGTNATYGAHSYYSYGAAQAVCPKGWRPPTNAEHGYIQSFMGGNNSTGSSKIRGTPYNYVYGGIFYSSGWGNVGSYGRYWSSTQSSSTGGYNLYFSSSSLYANNGSKYFGFSVRCVSS